MFPNNCVVQDFCNRLGINIKPSEVQRVNGGLSRLAVQLLYIYRLFYENSKTNKLAQKLERLPGEKFYLHSRAYQQLADVDKGGLVWLRNRTEINFAENESDRDSNSVRLENEMLNVSTSPIHWLYKSLGKQPEIDLEHHDIKSIVGLLNALENMDLTEVI